MNRFMQRCWKVAAASFGRSRHVRHLALLETLSLGSAASWRSFGAVARDFFSAHGKLDRFANAAKRRVRIRDGALTVIVRSKLRWGLLCGLLLASPVAWARPRGGGLSWTGPAGAGGSVPWNIVVLLSVLTLLPAILLSMTPFVRLLVVFHFLRQALGTQSTPSNQTLIGLALILTYFLMQPVGNAIHSAAVVPFEHGSVTALQAVEFGAGPLRHFMIKYAREKDIALFVELAHEPRPASPEDLPMRVVVPAYILSELKAGFQIGAVLFLPFLVVDLVVAAITTSIGMLQLPPVGFRPRSRFCSSSWLTDGTCSLVLSCSQF